MTMANGRWICVAAERYKSRGVYTEHGGLLRESRVHGADPAIGNKNMKIHLPLVFLLLSNSFES